MTQSRSNIAFIGGSGLYELPELCPNILPVQNTPFGKVANIQTGEHQGSTIYFLPRHGSGHKVPPHKINYRANMWALNNLGVNKIVAFNAVGSIYHGPGTFVLPHQVIDYTYGREHTFADDFAENIVHVDFTHPFCEDIRSALAGVFIEANIPFIAQGVYGCTQGPRLESAAEIERLARDGCDLVGMTLMPEAALARELGINYGAVNIVVNWAAGKSAETITMEAIRDVLAQSANTIKTLLPKIVRRLST